MNRLLKNTSLYTLGRVLPKITSFLLLPIYTRHMSSEEYGISAAMAVFGSLLATLYTIGIDRCIFRLYWDYKTEAEQAAFLGNVFLMLCASAAIFCGMSFALQPLLAKLFPSIPFYPYYLYPMITAVLGVVEFVPKASLQIRQQGLIFTALSLSQFFATTAFIVYFVVSLQQGAEGMLLGQLLSRLILVPLFIIMTLRAIRFEPKWKTIKSILIFSVPLVPNLLSAWAIISVNRFFIERYCSLSDLGIYSLSDRIASIVLVFATAFTVAYSPIFHQTATDFSHRDALSLLSRKNHIYIMICCAIAFGIALFSREAVMGLLDIRYHSSMYLVPLLTYAYLIFVLTRVTTLAFHQKKKTMALSIISIFGLLLNLVLNWIFVPIWGVYGAAVTTVISNLAVLLIQYYIGMEFNLIIYPWKRLMAFSILGAIAIFSFQVLDLSVGASSVLKVIACLLGLIYWFVSSPQLRQSLLGRRAVAS
jgi:O-antigen/teichoic acid export membrane protein